MNCLILVALLLCCGGNSGNGCGNNNWLGGCFGGCNGNSRNGGRNDGCGCGEGGGRRERADNDDCGCRSDFRQEPRFEQRPFLFNQGPDCGREEAQNNGCDCDR